MKDWRLYPAVQTLMSMRGVNRGVSGLGLDDERGAGIAVVVHEGSPLPTGSLAHIRKGRH